MFVVMVLKMLTRTRNIVMRSVILRYGLVGGSLVQYPWSPPAGHHVGGDEEADPGDHDEHAGGEVAGDDVVRHLPPQRQLKPGHGVITCKQRLNELFGTETNKCPDEV